MIRSRGRPLGPAFLERPSMRATVRFRGEWLDLDVPDDRLVGVRDGPESLPDAEVGPRVREALEDPRGFPSLRRAVVPDDRVAIAWDVDIPGALPVLKAVCDVLGEAGVAAESIRVVAAGTPPADWTGALPEGVVGTVHDPDDRSRIAYLA